MSTRARPDRGLRVLIGLRPFLGHLHPLVPFARELQRRGHQVAVATSGEVGDAVAAAGLTWLPAGIHPLRAGELWPGDGPDYGYEVVADKTRDLLELMIGGFHPDVVIRDPTDLAPLVAADALEVPCATFGFSHFIVKESWRVLEGAATLERLRSEYGLAPDPDLARLYRGLYIATRPPSLEDQEPLPVDHLQRLRYEVFDGAARMPAPGWLEELGSRPVVLVTLGTVYNLRPDLFELFLQALASEELDVVCTIGSDNDPDEMLSMPANVRYERYLPHSLVLPRCSGILCHGGFNTVMGAICEGVPLVCVPLGSDQDLNARRLAGAGAGISLDVDELSEETVRSAVSQVVHDPSFKAAAADLRKEVDSLPTLVDTAVALERFVGGG